MKPPKSFYLHPPYRPGARPLFRFDVGSLAVFAIFFALLFGVLLLLAVPLTAYLGVLIFVVGVIGCQAFFHGSDQRAASITSGSAIFYLLMVYVCLTHDFGPRDFTRETTFSFFGALEELFIGGLLGYIVGGVVAGLCLIRDKLFGISDVPPSIDTALIQSNPAVMMGKPVVAGTRITVQLIMEKLAAGESDEQIIEAHPRLTKESIRAALEYAAKELHSDDTHERN